MNSQWHPSPVVIHSPATTLSHKWMTIENGCHWEFISEVVNESTSASVVSSWVSINPWYDGKPRVRRIEKLLDMIGRDTIVSISFDMCLTLGFPSYYPCLLFKVWWRPKHVQIHSYTPTGTTNGFQSFPGWIKMKMSWIKMKIWIILLLGLLFVDDGICSTDLDDDST
jgi:hypothetical protein